MHLLRFHGSCLVALGALFCAGCTGDDGPPTVPVTGIVTLNGTPVEGVTVTFIPASEGAGESAVGVTDASGKYSLATRKKDDGAVVGKYKVTMAKYQGGAPAAAADASKVHADYDISDEYAPGYDEKAASDAPPAQNLLPPQYANADQSGFTAEVVAGENKHDFDLKK
jgi:hypothetical protein